MSKELLDIQATVECKLTLKCIRDMIRTYRHFLLLVESIFMVYYPPIGDNIFFDYFSVTKLLTEGRNLCILNILDAQAHFKW